MGRLVEGGLLLCWGGGCVEGGEQGGGDLDIQLHIEADVIGEVGEVALWGEGVGLGGDRELLVFGVEEGVIESAGGVGGVVAAEVGNDVGVGVVGGEILAEVVDEQGVGLAIGGAIEVTGDDVGDLVIFALADPLGEFLDLGQAGGVGWS